MARILVVDPEEDAREVVCRALGERHHVTYAAATPAAGVALWQRRLPDLVAVDVLAADSELLDPWRALKRARPTASARLVLFTRRPSQAYSPEIDAVFVKPFRVGELCASIEALLRVGKTAPDAPIECDGLRLDRASGAATVGDQEVDFTPVERRLIALLYDRRPAPVSRGGLLHAVWGMNEDLATRTVDTHVRRVRQKLGAAGRRIVTVRGEGYAWADDDAAEGARGR